MQQENIQAVIVNIGDELLMGQVVNTNAAVIAETLNKIGVCVKEILTIGDNKAEILTLLEQLWSQYHIVFITGGLGTTNDDITKLCICEFFNRKLVENKAILKHIEYLRKARGLVLSDSVRTQALLPEGCIAIDNIHGLAPGMWIEEQNKILVSTPGVPSELTDMLDDICQRIKQKFQPWHKIDRHFKLTGISESALSDKLQNFEHQLPDYIKLAYLPKMGIVNLRLSGYHADGKLLENEMNKQADKLKEEIKDYVFAFEDTDLALLVGNLLRKKGCTLGTAESCTGGEIAHQLTSFAGASDYFKGSIVAYSNEIKHNVLQVDKQILEQEGAVSQEVVCQMANNILKLLDVAYAIAVSGIAGPGGGTPQKPVGTVWIAIADKNSCQSQCFHFGTKRQMVVERTAQTALCMLYKHILKQ